MSAVCPRCNLRLPPRTAVCPTCGVGTASRRPRGLLKGRRVNERKGTQIALFIALIVAAIIVAVAWVSYGQMRTEAHERVMEREKAPKR